MRKITPYIHFILSFSIVFFSVFSLHSQEDNYVLLSDASGFDRSSYEIELEQAATELVQMLKDADDLYNTTYGDNFKVYDFGYYLHNEKMTDGYSKAKSQAISEISSTYYIAFLKKSTGAGLYSDIEIEVNLPDIPNTCFTHEDITSIVSLKLDSYRASPNPLHISQPLDEAIDALRELLEKVIYCCQSSSAQTSKESKQKFDDQCTLCDDLYASQILAYLNNNQYLPYEALGSVDENTVFVSNDRLGVADNIISLGNDFVAELQQNFPSNDISFNVYTIDLSTSVGCELAASAFGALESNEVEISGNKYFQENVVILTDPNGVTNVYYKFDYNPTISSAVCVSNLLNKETTDKAFILPALLVRYILKKAALAGTSVLLDMGINTLLTKVFGDYDTWGEAWDNTELGGWSLFYAAVEGAVGNKWEKVAGVLGGCLEGAMGYFNASGGCDFDIEDFFFEMFEGCAFGLAAVIVGDYIGDLFTVASRHLGDLATKVRGDVQANVNILIGRIRGDFSMKSWKVASKHTNLRRNVDALKKIDNILGSGRVSEAKLREAIDGNLGDILDNADAADLSNILDRLNLPHVTDNHIDKIIERLDNYPTLKQDLLDNPDWFETFDGILEDPGKFWELVDEATVPNDAALAKWGQGHWWKNLREIAAQFEDGAARNRFKSDLSINENNLVDQVTLEVNGTKIRIDYLGQDASGKFHLGDAKFSTKDKTWSSEWPDSATPNQSTVYPLFQSNGVTSIVVKATDPDKLTALSRIGLANNSTIMFSNTSLRIFGSNANEQTIKSVVTIKG